MKQEILYNINNIEDYLNNNDDVCVISFFKHFGVDKSKYCSQLYKCSFIDNETGITYNSAEQYMMANKALLFNDIDTYDMIMSESEPVNIKQYSRMIKNFNASLWDEYKCQIVLKGNLLKFTQNNDIKEWLLNTGNDVLVYANQNDNIWGIGMSDIEPEFFNPKKWKGLNLLGFILMQVRKELN